MKEGILTMNTAQRATPPKMQKHEVKTLEVEEIQAVLEALKSEPLKWRVCVELMSATGARRGEILGLRWEHVDWKKLPVSLREPGIHAGNRSYQHYIEDRGKLSRICFPVRHGAAEAVESGTGFHIPKVRRRSVRLCADGGRRRTDAPGQPKGLVSQVCQAPRPPAASSSPFPARTG